MIDLNVASNANERVVLALIRAMELGTLPDAIELGCSDDFVWANSGLATIHGKQALWAQLGKGGFSSDITILKTMTHFGADLIHMASSGEVVFTERVDHHWDEAGRDLMTPHICGIAEILDGKITAFRDFYDVDCYHQQPTEIQPGFDLASYRTSQA